MKNLISNYKNLSFEQRTILYAKFSIIFNIILAFGKFILAIFNGPIFIVAGIINLFILLSKIECYKGAKKVKNRSFRYRNNLVGISLILAGVQYTIYMARLFIMEGSIEYNMVLGVCIALVSFVELGVAIKGCFNVVGKGHYFRNLKLINLCSAFTAIVLTEMAITSFSSSEDHRLMDATFGISVGVIIIFIGVYVLLAPKISIVDREHNIYKSQKEDFDKESKEIVIPLTFSKFYGNYTYKATKINDLIDGHISKGKSPIFKWNIFIKIIAIILSEILVFPYALGALVFHFKNAWLIKKLDNIMLEKDYVKINNIRS